VRTFWGQVNFTLSIMNNIIELAKQCPDVIISVRAGELVEMADYLVQSTKKNLEQTIQDSECETYPSPKKTGEILDVSPATLWRWQKSNYLKPVTIGGKRRYRMSDINRILGKEKVL
jgi:hypothetical protein